MSGPSKTHFENSAALALTIRTALILRSYEQVVRCCVFCTQEQANTMTVGGQSLQMLSVAHTPSLPTLSSLCPHSLNARTLRLDCRLATFYTLLTIHLRARYSFIAAQNQLNTSENENASYGVGEDICHICLQQRTDIQKHKGTINREYTNQFYTHL